MSYIPKHRFFRVLVPKSNNHPFIDPRSAIVTREPLQVEEGRVRVYYEGNRLGAENLTSFLGRALCAAGRDSERYPTVAMAQVLLEDFLDVGRLDLLTGQLLTLSEPKALLDWLDGQPLPAVGDERFLLRTGGQKDGDEVLYWSNSDGWGDRHTADVFHAYELGRMHLPMPVAEVRIERALPSEGVNPLEAPLRDVISDLEAIRHYAAPLLFQEGLALAAGRLLDKDAETAVTAILERLTEACKGTGEYDLGELYSGCLSDELQHHLASDHADERLDDARRALQGDNPADPA